MCRSLTPGVQKPQTIRVPFSPIIVFPPPATRTKLRPGPSVRKPPHPMNPYALLGSFVLASAAPLAVPQEEFSRITTSFLYFSCQFFFIWRVSPPCRFIYVVYSEIKKLWKLCLSFSVVKP